MIVVHLLVATLGRFLDRVAGFSSGRFLSSLWPVLVCVAEAQAQFTTIINTPPTPTVSGAGANTQVNVYDGGSVNSYSTFSSGGVPNAKTELNIYGGTVGYQVNTRVGTTTNIFGGHVQGINAYEGAVINLFGGTMDGTTVTAGSKLSVVSGILLGATAKTGSAVTVSGGVIGPGFRTEIGSSLNVSGGTFGDKANLSSTSATISGGTFGDDTQFSSTVTYLSGGSIGWRFLGSGQLNMSGGFIDRAAKFQYGILNLSGGRVGDFFTANSAAVVNMSGGVINNYSAQAGSTLNMSGGVLGSLSTYAGSSVTLSGGDFKLDGVSIAGLETVGNTLVFNPPVGSVLSGVLTDGTPFVHSLLDYGRFATGSLKLKQAAVAPIGPATIDAQRDPVPLGIRNGQTLIVPAGTTLAENFVAGEDSSVVITGGQVGRNLKAIGSHVSISGGDVGILLYAHRGSTLDISGGTVDGALYAFPGSAVNVSGGTIGQELNVFGGSTLNISGGAIGDRFTAQAGSSIVVSGGEFRLNGQLIPGLAAAGSTAQVNLLTGGVLSGILADGTPFAFSDLERDTIANGTTILKAASIPTAAPSIIHVPTDAAPRRIGASQTLIVAEGGAIGPQFNAGWGSYVQITGGTVGPDFEASGSDIAISGGTVTDLAVWNSHVEITGGTIGVGYPNGLRAGSDSVVNISGGMVSWDSIVDHSEVNVSGGQIDGIVVRNQGVANVTGGDVEVDALDHSILNISGGHTSVSAGGHSVVNLSGNGVVDEFSIRDGSVANIVGGRVTYGFSATDGARVNFSGGDLGDGAQVWSSATMTASGGTFGSGFTSKPSSQVRLRGADFRIEGTPIDGLYTIGSTSAINVPKGSLLTGTLSDGTPFAFSSDGDDSIADGTLTLEATAIAPSPTILHVPTDAAPHGVHNGQTLVVDVGGTLPDNFNAGWGSSVIIKGGEVGRNFEAVGAQVSIQDGKVGEELNAFAGSVVTITGGSIEHGMQVFRGGVINVAGGLITGYAGTNEGGKLNISNGSVTSGVSVAMGGEVSISGGIVQSAVGYGRINVSGGIVPGGIRTIDHGEINLSGGTVGAIELDSSSVLNISGGRVTDALRLYNTTTANVSGGEIKGYTNIEQGTTVNVSGGSLGGYVRNRGTMNISGGAFGYDFSNDYGAKLSIAGADFRLDAVPIVGLDHIGNSITFNFGTGGLLTGTLADGTPFAFFSSQIWKGALTIKAAAVPPIGPSEINAPSDHVPLGIRTGQTMHVTSGGVVPDNFNAGAGSAITMAGGAIGNNLRAVGANLTISAGSIGESFSILQGSHAEISGGDFGTGFLVDNSSANISGGTFGDSFWVTGDSAVNVTGGTITDRSLVGSGGVLNVSGGVFAGYMGLDPGATVNVSGGALRGKMDAYSSSKLTLIGNDFRFNGISIDGLETIGNSLNFSAQTNGQLTGTLADGTPFAFDSYEISQAAITLRASAISAGPNFIELPRDPVPLGIHDGQTLVVRGGAALPKGFVAGHGSTVEVRGGTLGCEFVAAGATVNVHIGTVGQYFAGGSGSVTNIFDGKVGDNFTANGGSLVNIRGGQIGANFQAMGMSLVNISGGSVGTEFRVKYQSTVNITGGVIGRAFYAENGSTVNVAGGRFADGFTSSGTLTIVGNEFRVNGELVELPDCLDEWFWQSIPARGILSGTLADGSSFAFSSSDGDHLGSSYYNYASVRLQVAKIPSAPPTHFVATTADVPFGLRAGQSIDVHQGGALPDNFTAGWGSKVVVDGGQVGDNFEAVGADVTISGGQIGNEFDAFFGSVVSITGGVFGDHFAAHDGSIVNISGGTFASNFEAIGTATVNLFGTEFWLNNVPINGLTGELPILVSQRDGNILSGRLADGSLFKFDLSTNSYSQDGRFEPGVTLNLMLVPVPEPASWVLALVAAAAVAARRRRRL